MFKRHTMRSLLHEHNTLVEFQHGLPFSVKIPTNTTRKTLEDAKLRRNLETFNNADDLFDDLGF